MKKFLLSFVSLLLIVTTLLVGCGNSGSDNDKNINTTEPSKEPQTTTTIDHEMNNPSTTTIDPEINNPPITTVDPEIDNPPPFVPTQLITNVQNNQKVIEDAANKTISVVQKSSKTLIPSFDFYCNDSTLTSESWFVSGTINAQTVSGKSGHIIFAGYHNDDNNANIYINRRVDGNNGIYRNITQDGVRTPTKNNENVSNTLIDSTDWTAEFVFLFDKGTLCLYLKEPEEEFTLMTTYYTNWSSCTARFQINQYADVFLTISDITTNGNRVKTLKNKLDGVPDNPIDSKKILFIGNSATSVNDIPNTLRQLAIKAGYNVEVNSITVGAAELATYANSSTAEGQTVLNEINKGYDIVILQDHSNCISTTEKREASIAACKTLDKIIRDSGAKTYIYVRPPVGYEKAGYDSIKQCEEYDKLFESISSELGSTNVYVNRAFAYSINNLNVGLWGSDNAHTSVEGGYLVVCTFFSTLFNTSSSVLDYNGLSAEMAKSLQEVADKIVLGGIVPF